MTGQLRVPMLDVLRAVAIVAVFVQHLGDRFRPFVLEAAGRTWPPAAVAWLEAILVHGHWGVDLFFVLSGFTLGLGFVRQYDAGVPSRIADFFVRRAARILPAFYVALVVHVLAHTDVLGAEAIWRALAAHVALLQGYLAPGRIVLLGASWSLTTEAHFYVLAPLLARLLIGLPRPPPPNARAAPPPWRPLRMIAFVATACVVVWIVRSVLHDLALLPGAHAGLLELSQRRWVVSRVDQFAVGLAGALAYVRIGHRVSPTFAHGLCTIAALLLGLAAPFDSATYFRSGGGLAYPVVTLAMALLVFGAATVPEGRASRFLAPARWLGVVSYGVFLYHQLALDLVSRWLPGAVGDPSWRRLAVTALSGGVFACFAGWISWTFLESPVLAWTSARLRRRSSLRSPGVSAANEVRASGGAG